MNVLISPNVFGVIYSGGISRINQGVELICFIFDDGSKPKDFWEFHIFTTFPTIVVGVRVNYVGDIGLPFTAGEYISMRIIAVDDDQTALEILKECLTQGGFGEVTYETSPKAALKKISEAPVSYDCILLDIEMPDMSGTELCSKIRALDGYQNTPILMITRHKNRVAVEAAFAKGATDYVTKPFEFFEVLTRIKVAERLVQERQAALDSYIALHSLPYDYPKDSSKLSKYKLDSDLTSEKLPVRGEKLLSLSVFRNYVEQLSRADGFEIHLITLEVKKVHYIFSKVKPAEFVEFLKIVADAAMSVLAKENAFITHAGNGIFLISIDKAGEFDPSEIEQSITRWVNSVGLPKIFREELSFEIVIGDPLVLSGSSKLNFKRAMKASIARMEQRKMYLRDSEPLKLSV